MKLTIEDARRAREEYIKTLDDLAKTAIKRRDPKVLFAVANETEAAAKEFLALAAGWAKNTAERINGN